MRTTWLGWSALGLVACGSGLGGGIGSDDVVIEDASIVGVAYVEIIGAETGTAQADFTDASGEVITATGDLPGKLAAIGLKAGGSYDVTVSITRDGKTKQLREPLEFQVQQSPEEGPTFVRQAYDADKMCDPDGRVLLSWLSNDVTGVAVIDRDGNYRWAEPSTSHGEQVLRTRIARDGTAAHWMYVDVQRQDIDYSTIVTQPLDGTDPVTTTVPSGHHDFVEFPDQSTIAYIGYAFADVPAEDVVDLPQPWEGDDPLPTASDTIVETTLGDDGTGQSTVIFDMYEDYFPTHPITYTTFDRFKKGFLPGYHVLTHGNSLALVDDTYLLMMRWVSALVGVDRNTGEYWTLGGVYNEFDPVKGQSLDDLFVEPHFSDAWQASDGLHVLVFDNRSPDSGESSRASEYVLDVTNRTFERVWTYEGSAHDDVLGDVQRFHIDGCDNLLVVFSQRGRVVEVTRDGEIVWEVATRAGSGLARVQYLPSFDDPTAAVYATE